jgi:hypothetical protein
MAQAMTTLVNRPAWIDLSSTDAAGSREFYAKLLGWSVEVNPDPQYGGYAIAKIGGHDAAGIGPGMDPNAPTAWNLYIGTDDVDDLSKRVTAAGGTVVAPPFDVGDQGRMAVYQDPAGAFISAWQGTRMGGFQSEGANAFGWGELNARGVDRALPFYSTIFGWTVKTGDMGEGNPPYHEFQIDGRSIAGAQELNPMVPPEVPSYWMVYFSADDVDASHAKALAAGATEMLPPQDFPGGRFSILSDPQGATFGLLKTAPR